MATVLVRHKVSDFAKWKAVYDEYKPKVKLQGGKSQKLLMNAEDPHEIVVITEFENINKGREWAKSAELRQAMEKAGVSDSPTLFFLEEKESVSL